jgi:hypothetical protein
MQHGANTFFLHGEPDALAVSETQPATRHFGGRVAV